MDLDKVQAIVDWPSPQSVFEVRSFQGLVGFYRKFIKSFSDICFKIIETIRKHKQPFKWTTKVQSKFQLLKKKITKQPVLRLPDFGKPF